MLMDSKKLDGRTAGFFNLHLRKSNTLFQLQTWIVLSGFVCSQGFATVSPEAVTRYYGVTNDNRIRTAWLAGNSDTQNNYGQLSALAHLYDQIEKRGGPDKFEKWLAESSCRYNRGLDHCTSNREVVWKEMELANQIGSRTSKSDLPSVVDTVVGMSPGWQGQVAKVGYALLKDSGIMTPESPKVFAADLDTARRARNIVQVKANQMWEIANRHPSISSLVDGAGGYRDGVLVRKAPIKGLLGDVPGINNSLYPENKISPLEIAQSKESSRLLGKTIALLGKSDLTNLKNLDPRQIAGLSKKVLTPKEQEYLEGLTKAKLQNANNSQDSDSHDGSTPKEVGGARGKTPQKLSSQSMTPAELRALHEKCEMVAAAAQIVGMLAGDNKELQAAAMVAGAGAQIGMILTSSMAAGPAGFAIAAVGVGLAIGLKQIFGDKGPSPESIIFNEIRAFQKQLSDFRSHFANARKEDQRELEKAFGLAFDKLNELKRNLGTLQRDSRQEHLIALDSMNEIKKLLLKLQHDGFIKESHETLAALQKHSNAVQDSRVRLPQGHKNSIKTTDEAKTHFNSQEFKTAVNGVRELSLINGMGPEAKVYRHWDFSENKRHQFERMHELTEDLKSSVGFSLVPFWPQSADSVALTSKGAMSPDLYSLGARGLHEIFSPRQFSSQAATDVLQQYQCNHDGQLAILREYLDIGVNQRAQFYNAVPLNPDRSLNLKHLLPALSLYEDAAARAIEELSQPRDIGKQQHQGYFGKYDYHKPLTEQKFQVGHAEAPGFLFPEGTKNSVASCPKAGNIFDEKNVEIKLPTLNISSDLLTAYASSGVIHPDFLKARDILGGSFEWCYDDVGFDDEKITMSENPDGIYGVHSGIFGFTLKIRYNSPVAGLLSVANIRITDKTPGVDWSGANQDGRTEFYRRKYVTALGGQLNLDIPWGTSATTPDKFVDNDLARSMKKALNDDATKNLGGGYFPVGPFLAVLSDKPNQWDQRFEHMAKRWNKDSFRALENRLAKNLDANDRMVRIQRSWESETDVLHRPLDEKGNPVTRSSMEEKTRHILLEHANARMGSQLMEESDKTRDEIARGVGPSMAILKEVDFAKDRVQKLLWFAFGDSIRTNHLLKDILNQIPNGASIAGSFLVNPKFMKDAELEKILKGDRKLVDFLLNRSTGDMIARKHTDLDTSIDTMAALFWKRFLANKGCIARDMLPEALKANVKTDEEFRKLLALSTPFENPMVVKKTIENWSKISSKLVQVAPPANPITPRQIFDGLITRFENQTMADHPNLTMRELDSLTRAIEARHLNDLTQENVLDIGTKYTAAFISLKTDGAQSSQSALKTLRSHSLSSFPSVSENKLQAEIKATIATGLVSPDLQKQIEDILDNRTIPSTDRVAQLTSLKQKHAENLQMRNPTIGQVNDLIEKWNLLEHRRLVFLPHIDGRVAEIKKIMVKPDEEDWQIKPTVAIQQLCHHNLKIGIQDRIRKLTDIKNNMSQTYDMKLFMEKFSEAKNISDTNAVVHIPITTPHQPDMDKYRWITWPVDFQNATNVKLNTFTLPLGWKTGESADDLFKRGTISKAQKEEIEFAQQRPEISNLSLATYWTQYEFDCNGSLDKMKENLDRANEFSMYNMQRERKFQATKIPTPNSYPRGGDK